MQGVNILPRKKTVERKVTTEKPMYICNRCGKEKAEDKFFLAKWSKVWNMTNHRAPICKECIDELFSEYTKRYGSEKIALQMCCHYLDIPYYRILYDSIVENNNFFNVGLYCRQINLGQYQYKSFINTLVDGELNKSDEEAKEEREAKWSRADKQNMSYSISVCGYDPFDNCGMTDADRKYCFNILAGYCDTPGISEDGHKIQSIISIVQSQLQCRKLDEFINSELLAPNPDEIKIKSWATTKKQLLDSINKMAQDNNLSSAYNQQAKKGSNTLSYKMKEIVANGIDNIKVNLFDIKTCEAMKQIADLSNKSIMEQLTWDENDYTQMIKDQREMILDLQQKCDSLEEDNRLLSNKVIDLENKKKR